MGLSFNTQAFSFLAEDLKSRVERSNYFERLIDIDQYLKELGGGEEGGWVTKIVQTAFGIGKALVNFAVATYQWIFGEFSFAELWGGIQSWFYEIYYFDWNASDAELKKEIDQNNLNLITQLGSLTAVGTVWFSVIGLSTLAATQFPVLGGQVALKVIEEGGDEIGGMLKGFLENWAETAIQNNFLKAVLLSRKWKLFGSQPINESKKPWIIAEKVDKKIEGIKNKKWQAFWSGFKDQFEESFFEAGYIVATAIDDFYATQDIQSNVQEGPSRLIQVHPDANSEEYMLIGGGQNDVVQTAQNYLANSQLIGNRDVGTIVGQPYDEWYRAKPQTRKLTITFKSISKKPFVDENGKYAKQVSYSIPDAKQGLTWNEVKIAAKKFTWGKFRCTAKLNNGRQMAVYGSSPNEATTKLHELVSLSTATILTESVTEETNVPQERKKKATVMYPAYATMLVRKSTLDTEGTLTTIDGTNYEQSKIRVDLWVDSKPEWFATFT